MNSRPPSGRVVVVGTLNIDHLWQVPLLPRPGQTILADRVERGFGGKGANQAVAAARQGAQVELVGAVGDDSEGAAYREHLRRQGVGVDHVREMPGVGTGSAHVYIDAAGENLIVVDRGANARLEAAAIKPVLRAGDVLLVQLECALEAAVGALRVAESVGARALLNASPSWCDFPWAQQTIEAVIVNEHECLDSFAATPRGLWTLSSAERAALLAKRRVKHLVVTQGAAATLHFHERDATAVPAFPVQPRDTVGAGDTFAGALAAELAAGADWPVALRYANVAAALSTLALGAQTAMPTRSEVAAALARGSAE